MLPRTQVRALTGVAVMMVALGMMVPSPAVRACGGMFCNATIPVGQTGPIRIVQAGERVLFAKLETGIQMIVEVRYDGDPTSFAWLLPIPRPAAGMALEDILGVSLPEVFDRVQDATEPSFFVAQVTSGPNTCSRADSGGSGCGGDDATATNASATGDGSLETNDPGRPGVTISDEARVGPYDAQLLDARDAESLYTWLGDNGYYQDPMARPLLAHYIATGWSFIAIRLQNQRDLGDIRPITLTLGENAPCVPLRLTAIAANDDMPILVWVLGPGRAIPKNFLHAVVNDQALTFPGAPEYMTRVSEAIDGASGRAWVTEFAGAASSVGTFISAAQRTRVSESVNLGELRQALMAIGDGPTVRSLLSEELVPPEAFAEAFTQSPLEYMDVSGMTYVDDFETLRERLLAELVAPLEAIDKLFAESTTLTRFITTIDPSEMTRDPIFAFNPDLPDVAREHGIKVETRVSKSCQQNLHVTYPDGSEVTTVATGATVAAVPGAPALLRVELIDESGPPIAFDPEQVVEIDRVIAGATVGAPTLPAGYQLNPAPRDSNAADGDDDEGGCALSLPGAFLMLPLGLLALRARRARRVLTVR